MTRDFDNLTMKDMREITDDELSNLSREQLVKYTLAIRKYAFLMGTCSEPTKVKDFIENLNEIKNKINENTTLCVILKDEYECIKDNFMKSEHCFVAYIDEDENKLIVQNFV